MVRYALGLVLVIVVCATASARPGNDVTTTYFSDASHQKVVGYIELTCGGGRIKFGKVTNFSTKFSDPCSEHRISQKALEPFSRLDKTAQIAACHMRCSGKFGLCFLDSQGVCPEQQAIDDCNAFCDAQKK